MKALFQRYPLTDWIVLAITVTVILVGLTGCAGDGKVPDRY